MEVRKRTKREERDKILALISRAKAWGNENKQLTSKATEERMQNEG